MDCQCKKWFIRICIVCVISCLFMVICCIYCTIIIHSYYQDVNRKLHTSIEVNEMNIESTNVLNHGKDISSLKDSVCSLCQKYSFKFKEVVDEYMARTWLIKGRLILEVIHKYGESLHTDLQLKESREFQPLSRRKRAKGGKKKGGKKTRKQKTKSAHFSQLSEPDYQQYMYGNPNIKRDDTPSMHMFELSRSWDKKMNPFDVKENGVFVAKKDGVYFAYAQIEFLYKPSCDPAMGIKQRRPNGPNPDLRTDETQQEIYCAPPCIVTNQAAIRSSCLITSLFNMKKNDYLTVENVMMNNVTFVKAKNFFGAILLS
ncbi:hypothetical protein MAR_013231 [Mya arenaria]|uniref:THD domain-containing protein n=1 Tax=Mya arenaria TaxID=6604 RepID=A0ABY7G0V2_MYAAR|nr:hypothetical protein MAR_013231 [Mya arenaria]